MTHDRTTARYTRVATGMIANIEKPTRHAGTAAQKAQRNPNRGLSDERDTEYRPAAGVTRGGVPSKAGESRIIPHHSSLSLHR
jgi:hypothetical protein